MRPIFQAERVVSRAFGDPRVYVDLKFPQGALLFDIDDVTALPPRKLAAYTWNLVDTYATDCVVTAHVRQ
jgi:hypothetical protein